MAKKHLWYGLTGTVGMSATTIASAQVGDPLPVVIPALVAGAAVAGHHITERRAESDDQEDDRDDTIDLEDPSDSGGSDDLSEQVEQAADAEGRTVVVIEEDHAA